MCYNETDVSLGFCVLHVTHGRITLRRINTQIHRHVTLYIRISLTSNFSICELLFQIILLIQGSMSTTSSCLVWRTLVCVEITGMSPREEEDDPSLQRLSRWASLRGEEVLEVSTVRRASKILRLQVSRSPRVWPRPRVPRSRWVTFWIPKPYVFCQIYSNIFEYLNIFRYSNNIRIFIDERIIFYIQFVQFSSDE